MSRCAATHALGSNHHALGLVVRCVAAAILAALSLTARADEVPPLSYRAVGGETLYTIKRGDFLIAIGARFGVDPEVIAAQNGIALDAIIRPGQQLRIDNRHLVPAALDDGVVINLPQRMLFHFRKRDVVAAYPVGLGRPTWPTPPGQFKIESRVKDKPWLVPKSIQEEMRAEGKAVREEVPPGPDNPLGSHWLGISIPGYGIHSTIAPASIYRFQSHGCIRLHPDDISELFDAVAVGTRGRLIYQPVLLAWLEDGRILLEVHPDIYGKAPAPARVARDMAQTYGLVQGIDWKQADAVIAAQEGLAREVGFLTRRGKKGTP
jgi:L,D-transpeptidase ErfK/SrfK